MKNLLPFRGRTDLPSAPFSVSRDIRQPGQLRGYTREALESARGDQITLHQIAHQALKEEWTAVLRRYPSLANTSHPQTSPGKVDIVHQYELAPKLDDNEYRDAARKLLKAEKKAHRPKTMPRIGALALTEVVTHEVNYWHTIVLQPPAENLDPGVTALRAQRADNLRLLGNLDVLRPEFQYDDLEDVEGWSNPANFDIGVPLARFPSHVAPGICRSVAQSIQSKVDLVIAAGGSAQPGLPGQQPNIAGLSSFRVEKTELLS